MKSSEEVSALKYRPPSSNEELMDTVSNRRFYLGLDMFDERALRAMRKIDRADFVPAAAADVYEDEPVPIGQNQTCSQPSMVAAMATMLELGPGMKALEIGAGCGYSAAVTAQLIEPGGKLFSIEIIPELTELARRNLRNLKAGADIDLITGDGSVGLPAEAPFDRIYLTAGVGKHFDESILTDQLKPGGILIYPESYGSMFIVKKTRSGPHRAAVGGVGFVFLKGENSGYR
jgi:protein-L-isoaspartate(D-aspartate) O-methyltransferase